MDLVWIIIFLFLVGMVPSGLSYLQERDNKNMYIECIKSIKDADKCRDIINGKK